MDIINGLNVKKAHGSDLMSVNIVLRLWVDTENYEAFGNRYVSNLKHSIQMTLNTLVFVHINIYNTHTQYCSTKHTSHKVYQLAFSIQVTNLYMINKYKYQTYMFPTP